MPNSAKRLIPGLVSITFRALTPQVIVALVAEAQLSAIEWGGDVHVPHGDLARAQEVGTRTRDAGLRVTAYGSYYRVGSSEVDGLSFERVLATAVALGAPVIRVWAGAAGPAQTDAVTRERIVAESRRIATLAAAAQVRVAYEFHQGTLTETAASALALLADVGHANMQSLWQPPPGLDDAGCTTALAALLPQVAHVHAYQWGPGGFRDRQPLAAGAARWQPWLAMLAATGRPTAVLLEFVAADDPACFRTDAQTLRAWLAALGQ